MMKRLIGAMILLGGGITAFGTPRYSVLYNQSCVLCHVDPAGGAARSLYGAQFFAYTDLAMKQTPMDELGAVQPLLNDQVQIGFDARSMFFGTDKPGTNTFMQMQGDLYLIFQLSPQWTFFLSKGLYSGFEVYGMGHFLSWNGYLKAGRFRPPLGMYPADHKAFVRERLGVDYNWAETGVEIGFHPQRFTIEIAATNGTTGFQDNNEAKAVTARADVRFPIGAVNLWLGATGRYNEVTGEKDQIVGGYGGLAFRRFILTGEVDYRDYLKQQLTSFLEAAYLLSRGWTIKVEHDFHDPDVDIESGSENMYVVGAEIVPTGFLQLIPNVRFHDIQPGEDADYYEAEIQLHIFF